MINCLAGFKKFFEDMDPSMDKNVDGAQGKSSEKSEPQGYLASLGDEDGLTWDQIASALKSEPWISTHFQLGQNWYKRSAWMIKDMTPNGGAVIVLKPQKNDRKYLAGNRLDKTDYEDRNEYFISRKELENWLTKGWEPAAQSAAGAAAGGI